MKDLQHALNMFDPGESSSGPARRRMRREMKKEEDAAKKPKTHEELLQKEGLFIVPWDGALPRNVRIESLEYASADEAKRFLQLTLIKNIQSSPLKLTILERWEKEAFFSFADAAGKL